MKFIIGKDRKQTCLFPISLEDSIDEENSIRSIDQFVDSLDLAELGFRSDFTENGPPAYHPSVLLKLYIYGYMNRVRSSRLLEKECKRNIELMWLLESLAPDHNTISNFRKDNAKAIKKVFFATVQIARNFGLIGATLIAGDSTKFRAQNSKKNNFNQKKIQRHLDYIDNKLLQYDNALEQSDSNSEKEEIKNNIDKHQGRRKHYKQLEKKLKESGEPQISTSDPDSKHLIVRNNITEVAYCVQTTVDADNKIPFDYLVTNKNDSKAMGQMLRRAKTILGSNSFTALYDKGYHTGSEFRTANQLGIKTLVAIPGIGRASQAPDPSYNSEYFEYNKESDTYLCPQGNILKSNGSTYKGRNYRFKQYKTNKCKTCPARDLCTTSKVNGKVLQRSEFQKYIEENARQVLKNPKAYKKRQAIVEHPYGTIKRQWGFNYITTKKTKQRASADVGLMFIVYNLKRIWNILNLKKLLFLKPYQDLIKIIYQLLSTIALLLRRNTKKQIPI
ncbi:IS1182 family transposase [Aureibaculum algae]|uniref:IS1182 family transposase n=1 Tax=Aureibaculum algae TaxID=2584122 RepID=A0A5B7TU71_9FLAO|nr:IS1182 family transposase [Aureibaculum algae]QCX37333.1 IS1182 family transposase [Aureibaculum algae]QCX37914.1 IS1182 family transposase [Aureibaculum algae]QCX38162.1 IS1182 family transposase [Aureibaculum algae]QCX39052.1 IS1182 family transposase [Aureibaculum algae]